MLSSHKNHTIKWKHTKFNSRSQARKSNATGLVLWDTANFLCFVFSCVNTQNPSQETEKGEKKHPKSFSSHNHSVSCMWSCRLTVRHVKWGMVLYLKGFKEASSSSSCTPVLQLIFVSTQTHHGLAVYVQLFIQSLQQGWTCAFLTTTTQSLWTDRALSEIQVGS